MKILHRQTFAALVLVILLAPAAARPDDPAAADAPRKRLVAVQDGGGILTVDVAGGELIIVTRGGDGTTERIVDLEQMGLLVQDGLEGVFAALRDLQLDLHAGADNRVAVSHGGQTFEVDVDAIMAEVGRALQHGLGDIESGDWTAVRDRDREADDLRAELRELKRELRRLERELERAGQ